MTNGTWLIDESVSVRDSDLRQIERVLSQPGLRGGVAKGPTLALRVQDLVIHDNRKWFGKSDIRLDFLIVHGGGRRVDVATFFSPNTVRFPAVSSGERLSTGDAGLLVFLGKPLHFLDVSITASRDRKGADDLSRLITRQLNSDDFRSASSALIALVAAPQAVAVAAAVGAAARLGQIVYRIIRETMGDTIGVYHTSYLQFRDNFGVGRHPHQGEFRTKDLTFWYELIEEAPSPDL